eukprot:8363283-Prorocentrum_lima.AAC.1
MLDSGAEENVAPSNFGEEGNDQAPRVLLRDVAGRPLKNVGTRAVSMDLGNGAQITTDFQVSE